ncbi:MAG: hypothetical protein L3J82_04905 [Planctomycetes bacterium]|nr:hypothetical protein [Planctomycetota bacterium]
MNTRPVIRTLRHRLQAGHPPLGALLLVLGFGILIFLMWEGAGKSAIQHIPDAHKIPKLDKILHLLVHAFSTTLLFWGGVFTFSLPDETRRVVKIATAAFVLDGAAGLAVEWIQYEYGANAGRHFSTNDLIANGLGSIIAVAISYVVVKRLIRPYSS